MKYLLYDIALKKVVNINNSDILDKLYFLEISFPTFDQINKSKLIEESKIKEYLVSLKQHISKLENKCPLYDTYTENLYLIDKNNVYKRVTRNYYRFLKKDDLLELIEYKNKMEKIKRPDELTNEKIRKINLIEDFLKNFDSNILYDTYIKIFYENSEFTEQPTTFCKRKSFIPQFYHIKPYYTQQEIINNAMNLNIYSDKNSVENLCKEIKNYEISAQMLLNHQKYIIANNYVSALQYYTIQGSHFINKYLRNINNVHKNKILEEMIIPLWLLISNSPTFDNTYTFYRFINNDSHMSSLKINDIYTENGFMSTTRDPFYRADLFGFGFILMKITVPKNKKGVALCVETLSQFPNEQEVLFAPYSEFKLIKKDDNVKYYHTDLEFNSNIKTRYEFEYIGNYIAEPTDKKLNKFFSDQNNEPDPLLYQINFIKDIQENRMLFDKKIELFIKNYVNDNNQFIATIGKESIVLIFEEYDSTGAYKKFYSLDVKNGYSIYYIYKGSPLFFIELAQVNDSIEMRVNYHIKYNIKNIYDFFKVTDFITFLSSIAYYFDIMNIVIYTDYISCDNINKHNTVIVQHGGSIQRKFNDKNNINDNIIHGIYGGSFCVDIYEYMKNKTKKFKDHDIPEIEIKPLFSYYDIDILNTLNVEKILDKMDNDELYQIYDKVYKDDKNTITSFYFWLKENKCYLLNDYIKKISRILKNKNPFENDAYVLDGGSFLYNRKLIDIYPNYIGNKINFKKRI